MKKLLLLSVCLLGMSYGLSAQEPDLSAGEKSPHTTHMDSMARMTLEEVYAVIDSCDIFQLNGLNEQFTYKARTEPSDRNKAILQYIRNRRNLLK